MLTNEQKSLFYRDGFCVVKQFYDLERDIRPIQSAIYKIIDLVAQRHGETLDREPFQGENFDVGYLDLVARNRAYGAEVYDLVKQIPAFLRLICSDKSESLFCDLRNTDLAGIGYASYGIRIDNPGEEQYRSHWHQEFMFQPQSMDGIVMWTPLISIVSQLGPVMICRGSHKDGLRQCTKQGAYESKNGAYKIGIYQEERTIAGYERVAPLSEPGDLVLMDFLTIHQSGFNMANRARWSIQSRYFNFLDSTGMKIGWKASVTAGSDVENIFFDYFV